MKPSMKISMSLLCLILFAGGCKSFNSIQTATGLGATGGEIVGEVFGNAAGNAVAGAAIGANLGEVTGAVIGSKMDKQAEEIKKRVSKAKVNRVGDGIVVELNSKILFNSNQSDLSPSSEKSLDGLVNIFNKYPDSYLEILGHTDNKGQEEYNKTLSEKRAASVAAYLQTKGINTNRITVKGLGNGSPKYSNETEKGRKLNRRVELLVTATKK